MPVLDLQHLKKYFATQKAVDDISLTIDGGSIFGLLGPNGAGKTTLIRMVTGIFYPDEGSIFFEGRPFDMDKDIAKIGYMPEERGLYKKMKIGEQATYLAQLKGLGRKEAEQRIRQWFAKLGMDSWYHKKVEDLSKGMQQKLQFVTTVVHQPSLVILDEPFSGLDPVNANLIKDEIFNLAKNGATIIFSTHRMEQVEEICNHIALINKGKKILDGPVATARQQYKENLIQVDLYAPVPAIALQGNLFTIKNHQPHALIIQKENEHISNTEIIKSLIEQDVPVSGFNEILPSLNDIFIKLVEGTPLARKFENQPL